MHPPIGLPDLKLKWWGIALAAALLIGCAIPVEEHGGLAPRPAAPDAVFIGAGAAVNTLGLVAKRPWWQRALAVGTLAYMVRVPRWGGRTEGAHFLVGIGAAGSEMVSWVICRGPCR